jgi:beta-barrel assembly-enhancing protease
VRRYWAGSLWLLAAVAAAQDGTPPPPPAGAASSVGDVFKGIGGAFSKLIGGRDDKQPLLQGIKAEPYKPSNQAIGEERDVESMRVAGLGLVPLRDYQAYANGLYRKLQQLSGVTGLPGAVYVLAKNDLEASSTPDGNVFLSVGWVRSLETEDELAALLAHELAHVLLRHHDTTALASIQKQVKSLAARGAGLKNQLANENKGAAPLSAGQNKALQRMELLIDVTEGAVLPAWSRGQENEADRLGFDLLVKAGYSPVGMTNLLERIASWEEQQAKAKAAQQQEMQTQLDALVASGKAGDAAKQGLMSAVSDFKLDLAKGHEGADKRAAELTLYTDKHHANAALPPLRKAEYQKMVGAQGVRPVLDAYAKVFDGVSKLRENRYTEAEKALAETVRAGAPAQAHVQPNYNMYLALAALGRAADAQKHLQRSFAAPEPAWKPFETAMRQLGQRGDRAGALGVAEMAQRQFKQAPALLPELVGIYTELRYTDEAKAAMTTCELQHPTYRDACRDRSRSK